MSIQQGKKTKADRSEIDVLSTTHYERSFPELREKLTAVNGKMFTMELEVLNYSKNNLCTEINAFDFTIA